VTPQFLGLMRNMPNDEFSAAGNRLFLKSSPPRLATFWVPYG
jgi:hypothetical protein